MDMALVVATLISAFGLGVILWFARPAGRTRAAHQVARKVDLSLDPVVEQTVAGRLARREQAGAVGGMVVMWGTVAALAGAADAVEDDLTPLFAALAYLVGHAVGYGVVAWHETRRPAPEGPRVARASTPTHDDYVARHERWGAWVVAGAATCLAVGLVMVEQTGALGSATVPWALAAVTAVLPWVAIAVDELLARRLLDRRQVAATPLELAWDDALRARTLRDMITVPLSLGVFLPLLLAGVMGDAAEGGWPANPMVGVTSGVFVLVIAGAGVMVLVSAVLNPHRHFRDRLWPRTNREAVAPR
jgi:hypothetical protein